MFPCTNCGLCCQSISEVKELKKFDLGNGVCKYFDFTNNICAIYDTRPDICRVDIMYNKKYHKFFTKKDFYIENAKICNLLQDQYNIDEKYKIIIGN